MENVHGISVAGGTFPATIWQLFMEQAIGQRAAPCRGSPRADPVVEAVHAGPVRLEPAADHDVLLLAAASSGDDDRRQFRAASAPAAGDDGADDHYRAARSATAGRAARLRPRRLRPRSAAAAATAAREAGG